MTTENDGRDATGLSERNGQPPSDTDESEILGLHNAIEKVLTKIKWHEDEIEERKQDIKGHEDQIEELRLSLRKHVGPLLNQSLSHRRLSTPKEKKPGETVTSDLIVECLTKQGKPVNTKLVESFLVKQGNTTNPSVELSRMVKRGLIERAGRGLYQLKK